MTTQPRVTVERITAPAVEPLQLAEVKLYLRVEQETEDALLTSLIAVAREAAEAFTGRSLITQSLRQRVYAPVCGIVSLLKGPVQSIQTVEAVHAGEAVTLDPETYRLHGSRNLLQLLTLPYAEEIVVTYVAGYGDASADVPSLIRQGMLQHIALMYENREASPAVPELARALYQPYREMRL